MSIRYVHMLRGMSRDARLAFVSAIFLWFSVFGIYSVLFNLFLLRLGFNPQYVGLANAGGLLSGSLFSIPSGEIGRRWGSRRAMIVGLAACVVGLGLVPLALLLPAGAREYWVLGTYFFGCLGGWALYMVNVTPYLSGVTALEDRNHAFSLLAALPTAAAFLGSLAGGLLPGAFAALLGGSSESPIPYGLSLLLAAVLLTPAVIAIIRAREVHLEAHPEAATGKGSGRAPVALMGVLALLLFIRAAGQGSTRVFFNVYLDDGLGVSTSLIGTLAAVGQLVAIPAALFTPVLAGRWGNAGAYSFAIMGMAVSVLPLALVPTWPAAALGFVGITVFFALASPAISAFGQSLVSPHWRPTVEGAIMMAVNLGRASMAFGGGYIIAASGYRALFLAGAGLMAAGAVLFWAYFRVPRGALAVAPGSP